MMITAERRQFGNKQKRNVSINIPDNVKEIVEKYKIEIVDYNIINMSSIYAVKDDIDIFGVTFNPNLKDGYRDAFKELVDVLGREIE